MLVRALQLFVGDMAVGLVLSVVYLSRRRVALRLWRSNQCNTSKKQKGACARVNRTVDRYKRTDYSEDKLKVNTLNTWAIIRLSVAVKYRNAV